MDKLIDWGRLEENSKYKNVHWWVRILYLDITVSKLSVWGKHLPRIGKAMDIKEGHWHYEVSTSYRWIIVTMKFGKQHDMNSYGVQ